MRIAIDIDDTISNTKKNNIEILKKYNYKEKTKEDFKNNDFDQFIIDHKDEILSTMEPIENAPEVINRLYLENRIFIISSRNINGYIPYNETEEFLLKYNIPYDALYLGRNNKGELCHDLGINLIIDDSENNLDECVKYGIRAIKFGKSNNYIAFDDWLNLENYLKEVTNGEDNRREKIRRREL